MNEDWEYVYLQEQAYLSAEKDHEWLEEQKEAKIEVKFIRENEKVSNP